MNSVIEHLGNNELPFGGTGQSGIGAYHGTSRSEGLCDSNPSRMRT